MFVSYICTNGCSAYRVPKSDKDLSILSLRMKCPNSECDGMLELNYSIPRGPNTYGMSAKELFRACMGHGLEDERNCYPDRVLSVLMGGEIQRVSIDEEASDENRTIINSLVISHAAETYRVHLGSGSKGVVVYKISKVEK